MLSCITLRLIHLHVSRANTKKIKDVYSGANIHFSSDTFNVISMSFAFSASDSLRKMGRWAILVSSQS